MSVREREEESGKSPLIADMTRSDRKSDLQGFLVAIVHKTTINPCEMHSNDGDSQVRNGGREDAHSIGNLPFPHTDAQFIRIMSMLQILSCVFVPSFMPSRENDYNPPHIEECLVARELDGARAYICSPVWYLSSLLYVFLIFFPVLLMIL